MDMEQETTIAYTDEVFNAIFSTNLMLIRKSRKMTQTELAKRIGLSRNSVVQWECAKRHPDIVVIMNIALALGVSVRDLVRERTSEKDRKECGIDG